jgi:hypothetical protein
MNYRRQSVSHGDKFNEASFDMNTDEAIDQLAAAFCTLETHNRKLYAEALRSLVNLAISQERLERAANIENDLEQFNCIMAGAGGKPHQQL